MSQDSPPPRAAAPNLATDAYTLPTPDECVSCGGDVSTPYCPRCGERRARDRKRSLVEFGAESFEALTSFDGRAIRTYRLLLARPGELTLAFIRGVRLRYLPPLQCFLIANLLFFLWSTGMNVRVLDTPLSVHVSNGLYGAAAKRLLVEKVREQKGDSVLVAREFETVTGAQAKSLVLVMVPLFALGIAALTIGRKRYAVDHIVFSLHFYTYLFVLLAAVVSLLRGLMYALPRSISVRIFGNDDNLLSVLLISGIALYLWIALRRVYQLGQFRAALTGVAAAFLTFFVFVTYRVLLFFITMAAM